MKNDVYTIENDFTNDLELFEKVQHKQVVYSDDRLYQSFILEWKNYRILDSREFIKNLQQDEGIMSMLSSAQPFACYGFTSNKLAITFKRDIIFSKKRALSMLKYIIKIGNTQNRTQNY